MPFHGNLVFVHALTILKRVGDIQNNSEPIEVYKLTAYSRLAPLGIFPPPPAVKASLSGTKETARTKTTKMRKPLEFIVDDVYVSVFP